MENINAPRVGRITQLTETDWEKSMTRNAPTPPLTADPYKGLAEHARASNPVTGVPSQRVHASARASEMAASEIAKNFPRVDGAVATPELQDHQNEHHANDPNARSVPRYPDTKGELAKKEERVPLWLNLPVGLAHMAWAMYDGFKKYGHASWRTPGVSVTALSMIGAAERHLQLLKDGQDYATDSNVHHAGHVMACMQIYLDCEASQKAWFDNRVPGPAPSVWPCQLPPR